MPIVGTSASPTADIEARFRAAGADGFLGKPVDRDALTHALGSSLGLLWVYDDAVVR